MGIVLVPDPGSVIKNFQIVDSGSVYNGNTFIFYQGKFYAGKLNGPSCCLTNFASSGFVNIRVGAYNAGKPHGTVFEYVFPKSLWDTFSTGSIISATKYTQVFNNGVYVSTEATDSVSIEGNTTVNSNGYYNSFTFAKVETIV